MYCLFLINLPSVSNSNGPFENSWSKNVQRFLQPQMFKFKVFQQIFYITSYIIIYYPVFPCISTAEVINLITISDSKIYVGEQSTLSV